MTLGGVYDIDFWSNDHEVLCGGRGAKIAQLMTEYRSAPSIRWIHPKKRGLELIIKAMSYAAGRGLESK